MRKLLLASSMISATLLLGACGNNEGENEKQKYESMSYEKQEEQYIKETKKLAKAIDEDEELEDVEKSIKEFENNTEHMDSVNTEIGDYALKISKSSVTYLKQIEKLDEFKKENPDLEKSYDLAYVDATHTYTSTLEDLGMEYEMLDIEYKKQYLGKKGNETITDMIAIQYEAPSTDLAEGMGVLILEYDEELNSEQTAQLSNKDYRKELSKYKIVEEPDMSKHEYNSVVEEYNMNTPEFIQYDKVNEMMTVTDYNHLKDLSNGIEYAEVE